MLFFSPVSFRTEALRAQVKEKKVTTLKQIVSTIYSSARTIYKAWAWLTKRAHVIENCAFSGIYIYIYIHTPENHEYDL